MDNDRRNFLNWFLGLSFMGWLASILYPVIAYLKPPEIAEATVNSVKAGAVSEFANNSGHIIKFGRKPVILVRTMEGEFRAFSATCTHLDCIVQYRDSTQQIWCACHNGIYDLKGQNVSGPPPRALEEFQVNNVNDEIIIAKKEG